jgi:hypothetical protein
MRSTMISRIEKDNNKDKEEGVVYAAVDRGMSRSFPNAVDSGQ